MLKDHYTETTVLVLSIVMGLLMSVAVILLDGAPLNPSSVFRIWAMITLVIILVSIFLPYKVWSNSFCRWLGARSGTLGWKLADGIVPSLVLNTIITLVVSAANIFYSDSVPASEQFSHWLKGCLHDWPATFVLSYASSYVAEFIGKLVADRVVEN